MNNPPKSSPESPAKEQPGEQIETVLAQLEGIAKHLRAAYPNLVGDAYWLDQAAALLEKLGQGWIPVGLVQEHKDGRKSFYAGDLDPREVHDNGRPTYRVFRQPPPPERP